MQNAETAWRQFTIIILQKHAELYISGYTFSVWIVYVLCIGFVCSLGPPGLAPRLAITNFFQPPQKTLKFHNVINLRVVRNIFHISHYFYCKYAIIVVRKEVGVFIKILTKTYKGEKRYYASLVENKRIDGKVVQRVKANLGPVTEEQIPYLKAAYARKKPHLVYDDE